MKPAVLFALLLAACSQGESKAGAASLPPLQLLPVIPELEQLRDAGPKAPEQRRLEQLLDLGRNAFEPEGDARLAALARKSLLEEEGASWALEELLVHKEPLVRARAAAALGELGQRAALVPMLRRLKDEIDPMVRSWLAAGLAQLGCGGGFADLVVAMNNPETNSAIAQDAGAQTIAILKRAGRDPGERPSYKALQDALIELERHWLDCGVLPPATEAPKADALMTARLCERLLLLRGFDLRPVDETKYIFGRAGRLGLPLLQRTMLAQDTQPFLRVHSLQIVKQLGVAAAELAPRVVPLLGDAERVVRIAAAEALGTMRVAAAAPFLRPWLADPVIDLRLAAAEALGPIGDQAAEPKLREIMNDTNEDMGVRIRAAFSIALFERDRPGLRFLRERLEKKDFLHEWTVRELIDRAESWR